MFHFLRNKKKEAIDWLIIGLGNPGEKYQRNRHNIGWMVADEFAKLHNGIFIAEKIYHYVKFQANGKNILIVKPTTYMNKSGDALEKILKKYNVISERIIVILDEYNFPLGRYQIKDVGGSGGHNGMASILEIIGQTNFLRFRCGIDKNFRPGEMVDYVLSDFKNIELPKLEIMLKETCKSLLNIINSENTKRAISEINSNSNLKDIG
jgi:PTH1 family peptidyl-tRNA hydrolase